MALLKRRVTPARLAANRENARRSTGPRTAAGKSRSALNALRTGARSKTMKLTWQVIAEAPVGGVRRMARQVMTPAERAHPMVAPLLNLYWSPDDLWDELGVKVPDQVRSKPKSALESTKVKNHR